MAGKFESICEHYGNLYKLNYGILGLEDEIWCVIF